MGLQASPTGSGALPEDRWWKSFGDAQLDDLVDLALAGSPGIELAASRLREATSAAAVVAAARQPTLTANGLVDRERETGTGLIPPPYKGAVINNARATLDFAYEIDAWGKNSAADGAAQSLVQASQADQALVRLVLTTAVVQTYQNYQADLRRQEIATRVAAQRAALTDISIQRLRQGLDPANVRTQSEGDRAASRLSLAQIETALALDRNQLAALCGLAPSRLPALRPQSLPALPQPLPALSLDLLSRRPEIAAAKARVEAATGQVAVAHAQFYPSITLNGFAGLSTITLSKLLDADSRILSLGPALRLPLFDGGRLRANAGVAHAVLDEAIAQYNQTIVDAVQQVSDQLDTLAGLDRQSAQVRAALNAAEKVLASAQARRNAGLLDQGSVLQSQSAVFAQQDVLTLLDGRRIAAYAALMKALGGGFVDPPASTGPALASNP
jgi:NodT family efflux transporter outer membrane factor (OMF) lipoprotein